MSKFIRLLSSVTIAGAVRTPAEGIVHLNDDDADRLIADKAGEDVTADFSAAQRKAVPVVSTTQFVPREPDLPPAPHLSEIVADAAETGAPASPAPAGAQG